MLEIKMSISPLYLCVHGWIFHEVNILFGSIVGISSTLEIPQCENRTLMSLTALLKYQVEAGCVLQICQVVTYFNLYIHTLTRRVSHLLSTQGEKEAW